MTAWLFSTSVRANHQHLKSPHHAKNTALFFCCSNGISDKHAATPQISPTRCRFGLVVRYDYDAGSKMLVGRFKRSVRFVARSPRSSVNTCDQTEYANCLDGNATCCFSTDHYQPANASGFSCPISGNESTLISRTLFGEYDGSSEITYTCRT